MWYMHAAKTLVDVKNKNKAFFKNKGKIQTGILFNIPHTMQLRTLDIPWTAKNI